VPITLCLNKYGRGGEAFRVNEASAARQAYVRAVYSSTLVRHYFGNFPETTTMWELKSISFWLALERARRAVEKVQVPKLAAWLAKEGRAFAKDYRAGTGEARALILLDMRFNNWLPDFYEALYAATFRATVALTPQTVALRRKVDWELIGPWDIPEYGAWMNRVAAQQVRNVTENTKRGIARIIDEGLENSRSIDAIADRLIASYGFSMYRAQVVARTEVVAASNSTFFYSVNRFYNLDGATKNWLATNDHRTRPTHVTAGATQRGVPFNDEFIVGGAPCMFPGDSQLPARERIQCRCTATYDTSIF